MSWVFLYGEPRTVWLPVVTQKTAESKLHGLKRVEDGRGPLSCKDLVYPAAEGLWSLSGW